MNPENPLNSSLLIGSPATVFTDGPGSLHVCKNVFEGITFLRQETSPAVWVVFDQLPQPRQQALQALVSICPEVPVTLLVRMVDEPQVRSLIHSQPWACSLRYRIYPLALAELLEKPDPPQSAATQDELLERIRELEIMVMRDDLTGLKNRRYLRRFLPAIMQQARQENTQVTLLLFDIDNFKHYNDTYGHAVGDDVLRQTAELMRRCCRSRDVVARLGGDEFAVVFWDVAQQENSDGSISPQDRRKEHQEHPREALFMAERFRREMSEKNFDLLGEKGKGRLTISGGLATFPDDAQEAGMLLERADQAMLDAKRSGKNRITLVAGSS